MSTAKGHDLGLDPLGLGASAGAGIQRRPPASGRLLVRNAAWNLVGSGSPLLIALLVVPLLIRDLGTAKYGLLAIAWGVMGYFAVLRLGLDFALAKLVGERAGEDAWDEIYDLLHTALVMSLMSGLVGSIVLISISHPLAYSWLKVPAELRAEVCTVFRLFAIALPFVISSACFVGTLWGLQRYDLAGWVSVVTGVLTFAVPAAILSFSRSLVPIAAGLVVVQGLSWGAFLWVCKQVLPKRGAPPSTRTSWVKPLLTFGGWLTVGGLAEPVFLYSDRFLLAALISVSAVTYFATPLDMIIKLWIIADSLNGALLPAYTSSLRVDGKQAMILLEGIGNYVFPVMFGPVLFAAVFSREILTFWIGPAFAAHSAIILSWLAVGVLFGGLARIPWTFLIAAHRPDVPGKLALIEAPAYLPILYFSIRYFGLEGAAVAWVSRMFFDCCTQHLIMWRLLPGADRAVKKNAVLIIIALLLLAGTPFLPQALAFKALYVASAFGIVLSLVWVCILSPDERAAVLAFGRA